MTTCQTHTHAWARFWITWTWFRGTHTLTDSLAFLGLPWSLLLCTLIGPCGCHAVARPRPCWVVIGVCGIAAWRRCFDWQVWPPALPWLPTWCGRGWGGWEDVARGWQGVKARLVTPGGWIIRDGLQWNMWWSNTRQIQQEAGWWHVLEFYLFTTLQKNM